MKKVIGIAILALMVLILSISSVSAAVSCHSPAQGISTPAVSSSSVASAPCGVSDCPCGCLYGKACSCQNTASCTGMMSSCASMGKMSCGMMG